jgi:type VI secretion system protein ImpC
MTESVQKWLERARPPRVKITYDVETGGAIEERELPFIVGVFADLSGDRDADSEFAPCTQRQMLPLDRDNFNDVMKSLAPRVALGNIKRIAGAPGAPPAGEAVSETLSGAITFDSLDAFDPVAIVKAIPDLNQVYVMRRNIRQQQTQAELSDAPTAGVAEMDAQIADIDKWLSAQLSAIMHAPSFQAVEATWRGLHYFVSNTETGAMLKINVFNATKDELLGDMQSAGNTDQSHLFKMIYEAEYGTFGGQPYSLLVGGYEIGRSAADIDFLHKVSAVAAAAHAPFITAASAELFGLTSFSDLAKPRDLQKIFESRELAAWQEFRESEDSRYVSLVLPHVLLRLPYGKNSLPAEGMDFEEFVGPPASQPDGGNFLWGNAAYLLAQRITNAFALYSWTAAIRGIEGGGLVEGLPTYSYRTDAGTETLFCPTEVFITGKRKKELTDLGFLPLCHTKGTGQAAFLGGQTSHQPKQYFTDVANANAKISAMLPCMLAVSRFAHYIKVIMREKIGSFMTRGNVETYLNTWIANYVLLDDNAPQAIKASYPLSEASVVVTNVPGRPGAYSAVFFIKPHFQLEELTTSIRLVASLPG